MRNQQWQRLGDPARQVRIGVDRHQTIDVERRADVDIPHPGMCVRTAHERNGQRIVAEIVEVGAVAAEQAVVFKPRDRLAEHRGHDVIA